MTINLIFRCNMKRIKEEKICSYTQPGCRLQLVKFGFRDQSQLEIGPVYVEQWFYQVRLNRKVLLTDSSENKLRKFFANKVCDIVLQLKIE